MTLNLNKPRTLRQKQLLKELPKNGFNMQKAGEKAGYSTSYARTHLYKTISKYQRTEAELREDFIKGLDKDIKRFKKEGDNTAYMRAKELKSKIMSLPVQRTEVTNKNPDKVVIVYDKQKQEAYS